MQNAHCNVRPVSFDITARMRRSRDAWCRAQSFHFWKALDRVCWLQRCTADASSCRRRSRCVTTACQEVTTCCCLLTMQCNRALQGKAQRSRTNVTDGYFGDTNHCPPAPDSGIYHSCAAHSQLPDVLIALSSYWLMQTVLRSCALSTQLTFQAAPASGAGVQPQAPRPAAPAPSAPLACPPSRRRPSVPAPGSQPTHCSSW